MQDLWLYKPTRALTATDLLCSVQMPGPLDESEPVQARSEPRKERQQLRKTEQSQECDGEDFPQAPLALKAMFALSENTYLYCTENNFSSFVTQPEISSTGD